MPNVQLLSEVDPLYPGPLTDPDKPRFTPSDMPALLRSSTRGTSESLIAKVFQAGLQVVHEHSVARGLRLVLRDHAHTHYCRGNVVPARPTLRELVSGVAPVVSVITVRHPVDSFVSLRSNEWLHFSPPNFETYCQRYLKFLDDHATSSNCPMPMASRRCFRPSGSQVTAADRVRKLLCDPAGRMP
jgi:hypothetical protein